MKNLYVVKVAMALLGIRAKETATPKAKTEYIFTVNEPDCTRWLNTLQMELGTKEANKPIKVEAYTAKEAWEKAHEILIMTRPKGSRIDRLINN
jgi:hypothetical protein